MSEQWNAPDVTVVTGGAGWFGRALLQAFADPSGEWHRPGELRVLVREEDDEAAVHEVAPGAKVTVGDVADAGAVASLFAGVGGTVDVIHAAGVIHPKKFAEFDRVNLGGTTAMLTGAQEAGVRRFVHLSSNSPFGTNPDPTDVFRADEPYRPYLAYGLSKMNAELAVKAAHERGDVNAVIVRPPWFYGPFQPERQTAFFTMIRKGRFPVFGNGTARRSMVYVGNLVQGVVRAELAPAAGGKAYWIADARPYTVNEIVKTVAAELKAADLYVVDRVVRLPNPVGTIAEKVDRVLQGRGLYHQRVHVLGELNKTIACDITAAREELGYEPTVELAEGMRESIRWCRDRGITL